MKEVKLWELWAKNCPSPGGALVVEAKVAEEGIILARDLGLSEVIMEGDALTMMSALSGLNPPPPQDNSKPSLYGCIFNGILPQLMNLRMNWLLKKKKNWS